jgi:hypothetical protein
MFLILYLIDWRSAIHYGSYMTGITWEINHFNLGLSDESLCDLASAIAYVNSPLNFFWLVGLSIKEKQIINFVLQTSSGKTEEELSILVRSTYPIFSQEFSARVDMPALARKYEKVKSLVEQKTLPDSISYPKETEKNQDTRSQAL